MLESVLAPYSDWGLVILRLMMAVVFIYHGYQKLPLPNSPMGGPRGFAGFLGRMGIPFPLFLSWVVVIVEFGGGLFLIFGLLTRLVALLMAVIMVVAIRKAKIGTMKVGFAAQEATGWEMDFALLGAALALFFLGGGAISLDSLLNLGL